MTISEAITAVLNASHHGDQHFRRVLMVDDAAELRAALVALADAARSMEEMIPGVFRYKVTGEGIKPRQVECEEECYCHDRDGSYVCAVCYNKGLRGHMQR